MASLIVLGLLAGLAALIGAEQRSSRVDSVRTRSGPLTVSAQQLYRALSDADATAAAAFLSSGAEPADLRQRYQQDISAATAALAQANPTTAAGQRAVAQLAQSLPVYTGLVETARANNRLNLPIGSAYLREAAALMRGTLLTAAETLYAEEAGRLGDEGSAAGALPWFALFLVIVALIALILAQRSLARRTHRVFNVGLGVATAAGLALLLWLGVSWISSAGHLHSARTTGSAQVDLLAQTRIAALRARSDEALTLVARGNGGDYEADFQTNMAALGGPRGLIAQARAKATDPKVRTALADLSDSVTRWQAAHVNLRKLDEGGQYPDAVKVALDTGDGGAAGLFNRADTDLDRAISITSTAFDTQAGRAAGALTGAGFALGAFTLVLIIGVAAGLTQRIAEYR